MNYLDKTLSTFFGILQEKMSRNDALGNRKLPFEGSQANTLDVRCGILVPDLPQIALQYDVDYEPK